MDYLIINKQNVKKSKLFIDENKDDIYIVSSKNFIDNILKLMKNSSFKKLEELNIDNLRLFWFETLEEYKNGNITQTDILNIIDSFENYINRRFEKDYPEFEWLIFPNYDPRSIGLNTTQFVKDATWFGDLSNDWIKVLQEYIHTPYGQEEKSTNRMDSIFAKMEKKLREKAANSPGEQHVVTWKEISDN